MDDMAFQVAADFSTKTSTIHDEQCEYYLNLNSDEARLAEYLWHGPQRNCCDAELGGVNGSTMPSLKDPGNFGFTTVVMWFIVKGFSCLLVVLVPLRLVVIIPFEIFPVRPLALIAFSILWAPVSVLLAITSKWWLQYVLSRPVLAVPGLTLSVLGQLILMFAPAPRGADDISDRSLQSDLATEWPVSWLIVKMRGDEQER